MSKRKKDPATMTAAESELLQRVKKAGGGGLTPQDHGGPIEALVEDIVSNSEQIVADSLIRLAHLMQKAEAACGDGFTMACLWDAVRLHAFIHSPQGQALLEPYISNIHAPAESGVKS